MGKGTIVTAKGDGLYTISLDYGTEQIAERKAALQAEADAHDSALQAAISDRDAKQSTLQSTLSDLDAAIIAANASPEDSSMKDAVDDAAKRARTVGAAVDYANQQIALWKMRKAAALRNIEKLNALTLTETRDVWCADYTDDASGEVETLETVGEQGDIVIKPGAPAGGGSELRHRLAMSAAAAYFNAAMLPGVQRHRPGYRAGVLTSIDRAANTGTVLLDSVSSSAQALPINASASVEGPFRYMTCDSAAFSVGDEVVVEFSQSWDTPVIVGFKTNPKLCGPEFIAFPIRVIAGAEFTEGFPLPTSTIEWNPDNPPTPGYAEAAGVTIPANGSTCINRDWEDATVPAISYEYNNALEISYRTGKRATFANLSKVVTARIEFGNDGVQLDDGWTTDYVPEQPYSIMSSVDPGGYAFRISAEYGGLRPLGRSITTAFDTVDGPAPDWDGLNAVWDYTPWVCTPRRNITTVIRTESLSLNDGDLISECNQIMQQWFSGIPDHIYIRHVESGARLRYVLHRFKSLSENFIVQHPLTPDWSQYRNLGAEWLGYIGVLYKLDRG